ncbi:hypothetical protein TD95_004538 [Thielaviopsis punctulata]|uniref:DUF962 domain-containing protein n=1 Tax=Thielaviopsis punctulata TaxID=72032 RepID=A0A0F4ZES4_9PEZI|nr:hypothetical protein TD95_004538 [Thielaviopsis punctulata]
MSLERHLVFYGTYHSHPVNLAIHMCTVPPIVFAVFCLAANSGPLISLPEWAAVSFLPLNLGTIAALTLGGLYVLLEPVAGILLAVLCIWGTAQVNELREIDLDNANKLAVGTLSVGWLLQLIGNAVFEKHIHEKVSHVLQAMFVAPLFVWFKVLFGLGYRSELQGRVNASVQKELAKIEKEKMAKKE